MTAKPTTRVNLTFSAAYLRDLRRLCRMAGAAAPDSPAEVVYLLLGRAFAAQGLAPPERAPRRGGVREKAGRKKSDKINK